MGAELRLSVDIYSPHAVKTMKYTGNHPSRLLKIIPSLVKGVFRIGSSGFFEDEIKWDKTTDMIDFFGQWRAKLAMDNRTTFWIKVKVIGSQDSKEKKGTVNIYIQPYMVTKLPYESSTDKFLTFVYSRLFYKSRVRRYIERRLLYLSQFEETLKRELGLVK
jgi:hypothetical protein